MKTSFLSFHMRRRRLDAVFLINLFNGDTASPSTLDSFSLHIPSRSVGDYSVLFVFNFKVIPSARCVSADSAVCTTIGILTKTVYCLRILVSLLLVFILILYVLYVFLLSLYSLIHACLELAILLLSSTLIHELN